MWQDNVGRVLVKGSSSMGAAEDSADVDEAEDANCVFHKFWIVGLVCKFVIFTSPIMVHQLPKEKLSSAKYSLDCANLAHDYKEAVTYNLRRNKLQSSQHVAEVGLADFTSPMFVLLIWCNNCRCARWLRNSQVLHMKGQIDVGLGVIIEQFMQRRLFVACGNQGGQQIATMQRRMLQDAKVKFDAADLAHMHHIGYIDLPKMGRLAAPELQEVSDWCYKVLTLNPDFSTLVH